MVRYYNCFKQNIIFKNVEIITKKVCQLNAWLAIWAFKIPSESLSSDFLLTLAESLQWCMHLYFLPYRLHPDLLAHSTYCFVSFVMASDETNCLWWRTERHNSYIRSNLTLCRHWLYFHICEGLVIVWLWICPKVCMLWRFGSQTLAPLGRRGNGKWYMILAWVKVHESLF